MAFRSSPESSSGAVAQGRNPEQLPPLRFLSPSASSRRRTATCSQGYHPLRYGAFSAFLTPSRPSSVRRLPALFHAGPAHGVLAPKDLPREQSRELSRAPLPSCGWLARRLCLDFRTSGSPRSMEPFRPVAFVRQRYSALTPLQGLPLCPRPFRLLVVRPYRQPQPSVRFLPRGFSLSAGGSS